MLMLSVVILIVVIEVMLSVVMLSDEIKSITLIVIVLIFILLSVIMRILYAECRYAECLGAHKSVGLFSGLWNFPYMLERNFYCEIHLLPETRRYYTVVTRWPGYKTFFRRKTSPLTSLGPVL